MALKNRFCALILMLGVGFWGCSGGTQPSLSTMPQYDAEVVNSHYSSIIRHEAMYFQIMQLMNMGFVPEARKAEAEKALDRYIYWSAIAKVYVFHGQWAESDKADTESNSALFDLIKILQTDAI